jgi:hypothetical protein
MRVRIGLVRSPHPVSPALCAKAFFFPRESDLRPIVGLMHDDGTIKLGTRFPFCHLFPGEIISFPVFTFHKVRSVCMRNTVTTFIGELHALLLALVPYQGSKG